MRHDGKTSHSRASTGRPPGRRIGRGCARLFAGGAQREFLEADLVDVPVDPRVQAEPAAEALGAGPATSGANAPQLSAVTRFIARRDTHPQRLADLVRHAGYAPACEAPLPAQEPEPAAAADLRDRRGRLVPSRADRRPASRLGGALVAAGVALRVWGAGHLVKNESPDRQRALRPSPPPAVRGGTDAGRRLRRDRGGLCPRAGVWPRLAYPSSSSTTCPTRTASSPPVCSGATAAPTRPTARRCRRLCSQPRAVAARTARSGAGGRAGVGARRASARTASRAPYMGGRLGVPAARPPPGAGVLTAAGEVAGLTRANLAERTLVSAEPGQLEQPGRAAGGVRPGTRAW